MQAPYFYRAWWNKIFPAISVGLPLLVLWYNVKCLCCQMARCLPSSQVTPSHKCHKCLSSHPRIPLLECSVPTIQTWLADKTENVVVSVRAIRRPICAEVVDIKTNRITTKSNIIQIQSTQSKHWPIHCPGPATII